MTDLNAMKRLWVHEIMRVYYDRLVYPNDRQNLLGSIREICDRQLRIQFDELCSHLVDEGRYKLDDFPFSRLASVTLKFAGVTEKNLTKPRSSWR